jgi:Rrf2 family transcriptional regulator, iron-sulfur cluster assembly transcription factor
MLNQSAEYALRATLYMANLGPDKAYKATAVADALGMPANYLSKIMHELVRKRVLKSVRGPTGGYSLAIAPAELPIEKIIEPFQDLGPRAHCLMGDRKCDRKRPCAAHERWGRFKESLAASLQQTTLADMLTPLPRETTIPEVA